MTNSPRPDRNPEASRFIRDRWLLILSRTGISLAIILLLGVLGGGLWVWYFVHKELAPLVQKNLTDLLKRPVQLGKVERFTLNGIRFGASSVPAIEQDPDRLSVPAVDVAFDPLRILTTRTLHLNITLVKPQFYLEQDSQGRWARTNIKAEENRGTIRTELESIKVENGNLVLVPFPAAAVQPKAPLRFTKNKKPIEIAQFNGNAVFKDQNQQILFRLAGLTIDNGNLIVEGDNRSQSKETNFRLQGQNLRASDIDRLIKLPVDLQGGFLSANLQLQLLPEKPTQINGLVQGQNVTFKINAIPKPFTKTNGQLSFKGSLIGLENVTGFYGLIPTTATGVIDTQSGYNVSARTAPVELKNLLQTFDIKKIPVSATGEVQADLKVTGETTKPVVSGTIVNTKLVTVDRLNLSTVRTNFAIADATLFLTRFQAKPELGGLLTGSGEVKLGPKGGVSLNVNGENLPGDAIAKIYSPNSSIKIGTVSANGRVFGNVGNLQTVVRVNAPNAIYPGSGEIAIAPNGKALIRNTTLQVAGGTVSGGGEIKGDRWIANVTAANISLAVLNPKLPPQFQGKIRGNFNVSGSLNSDNNNNRNIQATGQGSLNIPAGTINATNVQVANGKWQALVQSSNVRLSAINPKLPPQLKGAIAGQFNVAGTLDSFETETINATGRASLNIGNGTLTATNVQVAGGKLQALVNASAIPLGRLAPQLPPALQAPFTGRFNVATNLKSVTPETIVAVGEGRLNVGNGTIAARNVQVAGGQWRASINATNVALNRLSNQVPQQLRGGFTGRFDLAGNLANFKPENIRGIGNGRINIDKGILTATNVQLASGKWQASLQAENIPLGKLAPQLPPGLKAPLTGQFNLAGSLTNFKPETIVGNGEGQLNLANGTLAASNVQLQGGSWQALVTANNVPLKQVAPQLPKQFQGQLTGQFNVAGNLASFQPQTIQASGNGLLNIDGGKITATNVQLASGKWQANVEASQVPLSRFSNQLRGLLDGSVAIAGDLANLKPSGIQAAGKLNFSQGIALIDRPLFADIRWDGSNLQINRAAAQGLEANGLVKFDGRGTTPQITAFNLNVQGQDLDLASLPVKLPNNIKLGGRIDFNGQLAGTPSNPNVVGDIPQLRNLVVNGLAFESVLSGKIQLASGKGGLLDLRGTQDAIALTLSPTNEPIEFLVRRDQALARGQKQGNLLLVEVQNFPLQTLASLPLGLGNNRNIQSLNGNLSGNFDINLASRSLDGRNVAIAKPAFNTIKGDLLTIGSVSFANGNLRVDNAEFLQGESKYALSGSLTTPNRGLPQFQAQIKAEQGKIQDILTAASIYEIEDITRGFSRKPNFGTARNLQSSPVGEPETSLQTQLRRYSEIETDLERIKRRREEALIPELRDLQGNFSGEVSLAGSLSPGFKPNLDLVNFDIAGNNLVWGNYKADRAIAKGSLQNKVLTFLPLRIESDQSLVAFSGTIGGNQQTGQLRVQNFPVAQIRRFIDLPLDITGAINGNATIAGSTDNPQARGEVNISDSLLNGARVQSAQGSFVYSQSRLTFSSTVLVENSNQDTNTPPPTNIEPIQIAGSIPYRLPFASVQPDSNEISFNVDVKNEGLALLNLVTRRQVLWVNGQGTANLQVQGSVDPATSKIQELVAIGTANVENATIDAQALPEPLTGVTGRILFDFDRIQVDSLQGKFSGGLVTAKGILPISSRQVTDNPLTVNIGELALNLKGLYSGALKGGVVITGTALAPEIGGNIELFNGQVLLAERTNPAVASAGGDTTPATPTNPIEFNNLQLVLGRGVQITQPPILNFLAKGDIVLNGTIGDIRPAGLIELERGQVNLFSTQFRLARGYPQRARFVPSQGLVPNLDVRLTASVTEVTRNRLPSNTFSSEISDTTATNLGALGTVRIQAKVNGPANKLGENLELTSNPSRNQSEIVALIGGRFAETLGQGDTTLGLVNLASTAILSNIQNVVGDALGLSEFRLIPTVITNDKSRTSTLGLAAEAGIDINARFSASVQKILTTEQAAQYNIRYRLNEQILLRGSTDLGGDNRAVIEYEKRF